MNKIFTLFVVCLSFTSGLFLSAQNPFSFTNSNTKFASTTFRSGNALSVVDMNGDGMDDIARLDDGTNLYYTIQRTGQTFNNINAASTGLGGAWAMVVADVDNDGIRDVAVGSGSAARVIKANAALTTFTVSASLPEPSSFFPQNMNFADIDNNGMVDLFICNDVATSVMYSNSGTGTFPAMTNFFNAQNPGTDGSGNYGSIWSDVDYDGDVDLYIAHCRQGTAATDGNRLDQLYINNGNGTYTLDATLAPGGRGLRNYAMTWTASFDDIDNDGDFDCVLTETDVASKLLVNDGNGYFTEITSGSGFTLNVTPYQSKMEDLDNDGYVDIIISGDDVRVFRNNHNNTFTLVSGLFNSNDMLSFATGDLNHDGKIDLYSSYGGVYNIPSNSIDDVLWLNTTDNGNHFITFNLQGTISNRDALGAKVEVYGAWGKQVREVRAGESYGTTNSFMCHFGLGTATTVDSAIIRWPRGLVTRLYNRPADQFITVVEGQCSSPDNIIAFNGPSVLCAGQSVTMLAPAGYSYLWNTGATTQSISTSAAGEFSVRVTDTNTGCSSISPVVAVLYQPNQTPTISVSGATTFCEGNTVTLQSSAASSYLWSNGATTQSISVTQSGSYTVTVQGVCAAFNSTPVTVSVITSHVDNVVEAEQCEGTAAQFTLQATGTGSTYWYDAATAGSLVNTGTSYTTPTLTSTTTYYVESRDTLLGLSGAVGPVSNVIGSGGYFNNGSYAQVFNALKPLTIKTVKVYANSTKNRTIELRSSGGTLLQSATINVPQGTQVLTLNFSVPAGTGYRLGWAGTTADFYRNSSGASYPYTLANLITVTGNTVPDPARWYAYYDWQVEEQPIVCTSVRVPVTATFNPLPAATITPSGPTSFCEGGNVTLTTDASASYLWNDNSTSQSLIVTESGNYAVTVTSVDNCSNSSSITVTKFSAPDASVATNKPTTICPGDSVTLSAAAGLNYSWSNGATSQSITVSTDDTFAVTVSDANSCSAVSNPVTVVVSNNAVAGITASGNTTFCEGNSVQLTATAGASYLWSNSASTSDITVNASGTYTVTVTVSGNCTAVSAPINVVVNTNPTPVITPSGSTTFCEGNSVDLSTGAAATYLWSTGSSLPSITVHATGSYSVQVTDANGCSASSPPTVVTVNPNPQVTLSGLSNQYGDTDLPVSLTGTPSGGTFSGTGVSGNTFSPALAGVGGPYTVTYDYTDGNGCSASASSQVTVVLGTSVHELQGINVVSVYPNPTNGNFVLQLKTDIPSPVAITVNNAIGQKVFEESNLMVNGSLTKAISIADIAKGVYTLVVTSGPKANAYKLVVQ